MAGGDFGKGERPGAAAGVGGFGPAGEEAAAVEDGFRGAGGGGVGSVAIERAEGDGFSERVAAGGDLHGGRAGELAGGAEFAQGVAWAGKGGPRAGRGGVGALGGEAEGGFQGRIEAAELNDAEGAE